MSILWHSGISTRGNPKIAGVYDLQTQEGFPIEMSFELAGERNQDSDWVEAFLSALERHPNEYETLVKQAKLLDPEYAEECERGFQLGCATFDYSLEKFRQYQQEKKLQLNPI